MHFLGSIPPENKSTNLTTLTGTPLDQVIFQSIDHLTLLLLGQFHDAYACLLRASMNIFNCKKMKLIFYHSSANS